MLSLRWKFGALIAFLFLAAVSVQAQATFNCLPSCDAKDARFLAIANGSSFITLSQPTLDLELSVPKGTTTFTVGVFDGDAKGGASGGHWDSGNPATFSYQLFDDPNRDHAAAVVAPLSGSPSVLSTSMPDNAWIDFTVNTDPGAKAPSGNYFYLLRIQLTTTGVTTLNAFKVRTGGASVGGSSLFPSPQPFSYIANVFSVPDLQIIYPNFPSVTPTTYDGYFNFYFEEPVSQRDITVWDGDFDHGNFDGTNPDTDDPDTPGAPFRPSWATPDAVPEGVASGTAGSTGSPPDDNNPAGSGIFVVRPPAIRYDLYFPDGRAFANNDPSGNQEWEQFKISTAPFDRTQMDYHTDDLIPPGIFLLRIQGVDMQNLNALLLPGRALCVSQTGVPCTPLHPFLLGDTVFVDENNNGVQDPGEPGIGGVEMQLFDENDVLVATTHTDADGHYSFEVEAFPYVVKIAPSNFNGESGGTLSGYTPTTPEECPATITNDNVLTCDFGFKKPGAVGNRVWNDYNGNGVQDPGEPGINNVVVQLLDSGGNVIAQDTTNGDGNYMITNIPAGNYTVRVDDTTLPGGLTPTFDEDGVQTPNQAALTIVGGEIRTDYDFGYQGNVSLGDRVWNDLNSDGVQDPGEPGFVGVTVNLYDDSGNPLASTVTGADGIYSFDHLAEGTYTIQVDTTTLPAGSVETYDLDGLDTPDAATVPAPAGTVETDIDFGYLAPVTATASLGDRVWNDANGNGIQDAGEAGINGVTVQLFDSSNNLVGTATTSGDGNYTFTSLAANTYTVRIVPATLPAGVTTPTYDFDGVGTPNAATVPLASGQTRTDIDFGYRASGSVGDRVWLDSNGDGVQDAGEAGINGVTVQLLDGANNVVGTTTTAGDGNYTFNNLAPGTYTVRVSSLPAGVVETYDLDGVASANQATLTLAAGANRTDVDFGYRYTGSVGDRVWLDTNGNGVQDAGENGINGVTVQLLDASNNVLATATTTGDGNYTFSNLTSGNYSVRVSSLPAGVAETYDLDGVASANQATFSLAAGANRTDVDFGYRYTGSVGDRVWLDSNGDGVQDAGEAGINGVTVQLLDASNNVVGTTTTAGDGNYTFSNLAPGTYTVRVSSLPAGVTETYDLDGVASANQATFTLAAGANRTDVDFGYRYTGSIGDRVWLDGNGNGVQDAGEAGINGVTVQLLDGSNNVVGTTTTTGDGNYTFGNLAGGTYTVRVSSLPAGVTETYDLDGVASANQATFTLAAGANRTDVDFGYRYTGSVGDRVWLDSNGNGVQDAGEAGINGVTVQLLDASNNVVGTTTTAGDGNYTFNNLAGGTYTVRVVASTLPAGVTETYDLDGVASANQATFTLAAGANRTDVDFGYRLNGSIGDRVWFDGNGDGVQDAGEAGINGVTVQLLDAGSNVIATATTAGDGNYTFNGLAGGSYTVRVVASTLPAGVVETYDLDGVATANQATVILAPGANRTDVDFGYRTPPPVFTDCATGAVGDPAYDQYPSGHAFYLPGIGTDFIFTPVPGSFVANADGTAQLTGLLRSISNPNNAFTVEIQLGGYSATPPDGSPKLELLPNAYVQNGGPIDPSTWYYYTTLTGTLTGIGNYAGAVIDITRFMQAFQVGVGANGKNTHFGASGWFNVNVISQPASGTLTPTDRGDIDIDLGDCPPATASVGDRVWLDSNGNGVQDAGETGINGVTVKLLDAYGVLVATTTTSGDGNYTFDTLIAGNYTVQVDPATLPAGVAETYDLDGVASANSASFSLATGAHRTDVDFGYRATGSVGDRVWLDSNGNGVQDAGEAGINGVTVQLLDASANVVGTATTAGDGNYTFNNLAGGTYTVRVSSLPAGVAETYDLDGIATANQATFTLAAGASRTDVDFGYRYTGSVGDRVWLDSNGNGIQDAGEAGINGVTVQLLDGSNNVVGTTTTAGDGNYTFNNLAPGTYTVRVSSLPVGVAETYDLDGIASANQATFTLAAGANRTDVDFGYQGTGSVGDRVWLDSNGNGTQDTGEAGINGVTVQLLDGSNNVVGTTTTAGDGNYTFNNLAPGTFTVRVSSLPAGVAETYDLDGVASANQATFPLTAGQNRTDVDFGYRYTGSVGDRVWLDSNANGAQDAGEAGINGVTVQLLDGSNNLVATTTTAGDGNYTFNNLAPGTYTVKVSGLPAGTAETYDLDGVASANQATFPLTAGQNRTDVDFGYKNTGSVGDRVWLDSNGNGVQDAGEAGINGVTVQLLDGFEQLRGHHGDRGRRQLHVQQPGRRHLHGARLVTAGRRRRDLRPGRRRFGQPGHLHPRRRRQPHRRRLRLPRQRLGRRPRLARQQRQRCPGRRRGRDQRRHRPAARQRLERDRLDGHRR